MDEKKGEDYSKKSGYGKRPIWFWILVYLVVAAVIYGVIYYIVVNRKSTSNSNGNNQSTQSIY